MSAKRTSYAWALPVKGFYPPTSGLSPDAQEGLRYARALARAALERSHTALSSEPLEPRLTVAMLELQRYVSASTIRRRIALARTELFGQLGDRGIYDRLSRERKRSKRPPRVCKARDCGVAIPKAANARRRFHHSRCRRREAYWRDKEEAQKDRRASSLRLS